MNIKNMNIRYYDYSKYGHVNKDKLKELANVIYGNFSHIANSQLDHSVKSIEKILSSENVVMYCFYDGNNMISYILMDKKILNDNRHVLYVDYLYVSEKYRKHGLGSRMIDMAKEYANNNSLQGLLLTTNVNDKKLMRFYTKHGFSYDMFLRTYLKFDILYCKL